MNFVRLHLDTVKVAELLIKNGASMSISDNYGDIPLGWTYRGKWNLNNFFKIDWIVSNLQQKNHLLQVVSEFEIYWLEVDLDDTDFDAFDLIYREIKIGYWYLFLLWRMKKK